MSRRTSHVCLFLVTGALALLSAACGGSGAVTGTGPESPQGASGHAILQGSVTGAAEGVRVGVVGSPLAGTVDEDGQFALSSVPAGTVTLRFTGAGIDAKVNVEGLQDGFVTSITVSLTGSTAQLTAPPNCAPTADTFFSGTIEKITGTTLVVAGRTVDASRINKVWRGERRIQLSELKVGEKVKVWGTLGGDGVVLADEIAALTNDDGEGWVAFKGKVQSVSGSSSGDEVHGNPNGGYYPTVVVADKTVRTSAQTQFNWSDRDPLDPRDIKVGQTAYVEGWKKDDGTIRATLFKVDGSAPGPTWVTFKGRVESVVANLREASDVRVSCLLKLTIAGRKVQTDGGTTFKWTDGSDLVPYAVIVGDIAYVEGWSKPEGYVLATKLVVNKR